MTVINILSSTVGRGLFCFVIIYFELVVVIARQRQIGDFSGGDFCLLDSMMMMDGWIFTRGCRSRSRSRSVTVSHRQAVNTTKRRYSFREKVTHSRKLYGIDIRS